MAFEMNRRYPMVFFQIISCALVFTFQNLSKPTERASAIATHAAISAMVEFSAIHAEKQEFIGAGNDFLFTLFCEFQFSSVGGFSRHLTLSVI
jgi:hypothetical protein